MAVESGNIIKRAINRENRIKLVFFLLSVLLAGFLVLRVSNMLVSTIIAIAIYYLLAPSVDFLERKGFTRLAATSIPFFTMLLLFGFVVSLLIPIFWVQIKNIQMNADNYLAILNQSVDQVQEKWVAMSGGFQDVNLKETLVPHLITWGTEFFQTLPNLLSQSFTVSLLAPLFGFFMLLDGRDFIRKWLSLVPNPIFEMTLNLNYQIGSQLGGFVRARLAQSALITLFIWIGLEILNFPYALILGIVAGILNIIPYVGPVLAVLPALLIAMANSSSTTEIFLVVLLYVLGQVLDTLILVPFLVARIVNLHPITVIVSIIIGAQMMGILGMIICIPLVSTMKVTLNSIYRHMTDFRT